MTNEQLVARIQAGEDTAENMRKLWRQNEGCIAKMAMRYQGYAELDDLKQEGYIGLCEAVRQYDPEQGATFISYAVFWIRQAMKRYIDNCCNVVRIPVHAREWIQKYNKAVNEYRKYYGTEPSERALCAMLKVSKKKLCSIQKDARMGQIDSLSRPTAGEDEELTLADRVCSGEDMEEDVIKALDTAFMRHEVWLAVDALPDRLPAVMRMRFLDGKTLEQAGDSMGVSRNQIRDFERKAFRLLRTERRGGKLRRYYEEYLRAAPVRHVGLESFNRTWTSSTERDAMRAYRIR